MVWRLKDDDTRPVITAREQILSAHARRDFRLPPTAIVFFMGGGAEYLAEKTGAAELGEPFPCFLKRRPVWTMEDRPICFLSGGAGAPMAADTVETLAALGVRNIVAVGMFGAFSPLIRPGEIIAPGKAFVEEGTSLHYYERIDSASPDPVFHQETVSLLKKRTFPVVSTDAVYRQTFRKEQLWRDKGAVGVDMETSAVFSVSRYLGLRAAAFLMASDIHPLHPDAPKWEWLMTKEMKYEAAETGLRAAEAVREQTPAPEGKTEEDSHGY